MIPNLMITLQCEPVGSRVSAWGEGPVWHDGRLWHVDIEGHAVVRFDPQTGVETAYPVGERVGCLAPRAAGGLLIAGDSGIRAFDPNTATLEPLADPEADLRGLTRFNDGKCDPAGRFWAGTISLRRKPEASLYRLDPGGTITRHLGGLTNSNGLCWSLDSQTMYHIDTPTRQVRAYDFDLQQGALCNPRVVVDMAEWGIEGSPDGMAMDAEGLLWVALCHGGAVIRFDPTTGQPVAKVVVPCVESTSCAFGGETLDSLYITTGLPKTGRTQEDGRLYVCHPGVTGAPVPIAQV